MKSSTKFGGIYLPPCNISAGLFPLDQDPSTWASCHDAYEYTWSSDPDRQLQGLSEGQRARLARSSGFCPQLRCQLADVSNAPAAGTCPMGMCFNKVEHGAASFGACCFTNGSFLAGQLIGYYDLLQATAKPIYSAHRVLLGKPVNDPSTSKETFINAHQLHAGLLVTQCPMLGTVAHIKRMVVEQRISRWLQIFNPTNSSRDCHLLLNALLADSSVRTSAVLLNSTDRLQSIAVDICHADLMAGTEPVYLPFVSDSCSGRVHHLDYTAYLHWEDFAVPAPADEPALLALATTFAQAVHQGQTVAINCLSGRGRSGSFASIVLGSLPSSPARSHDELIDLIVSLRERRDGLVETPQQYRFVSRVLGLADSADSQTLSQSSSVMLQPLFKHSHAAAVLAVLCVFFLLLPLRYIAQKHPKL